MRKLSDKVLAWADPDALETAAKEQVMNLASLPFIFKHVAVMPDCHLGKGAAVGSVIATQGAVIPAAVGVDIGCGMIAVKTKYFDRHLPENLSRLRKQIERDVPAGAGRYNRDYTPSAARRLSRLEASAAWDYSKVDPHWPHELGSLGSGNHFIEVCLDEEGRVWVVLHSGSRGVGNKVAMKHISIARKLAEAKDVPLRDRDLAYLEEGSGEFDGYIRDLLWCQEFALLNREEMMDRVLGALGRELGGEPGHEKEIELERINCHHNFTQRETHFGEDVWITRKGAIQMKRGQKGIIPGSMGTRNYVVSGLENQLSYHSAPHGAGRRFSRNQAKRLFTMDDFKKAMEGIECRVSSALLDELPMAYKDIEDIMEQSKDLVRVEHVLKQVLNVKGD